MAKFKDYIFHTKRGKMLVTALTRKTAIKKFSKWWVDEYGSFDYPNIKKVEVRNSSHL